MTVNASIECSKINELSTLPLYDARRFMHWLVKKTEQYFENPENQRKFEEWKKKRKASGYEALYEEGEKMSHE